MNNQFVATLNRQQHKLVMELPRGDAKKLTTKKKNSKNFEKI